MNLKNTVCIEGELVNWADFLTVRMFKDVDLDAIESLLCACPLIDLRAGETLISAGQTKNTMYLLLSGCLRIHLESVGGHRHFVPVSSFSTSLIVARFMGLPSTGLNGVSRPFL